MSNRRVRKAPPLRTQPRQERARFTVEKLKAASLALLGEAGVEKFTTNHVAKKAGVNVSTLYRYFPDKGHLLRALMSDFESARVHFFIESLTHLDNPGAWGRWIEVLVDGLADIRRSQPGGMALRRVMGAFPELYAVDRASTEETAAALANTLLAAFPDLGSTTSRAMARVVVTNLTHLLDMAFDTDPQGDPVIIREIKRILTSYAPGAEPVPVSSLTRKRS